MRLFLVDSITTSCRTSKLGISDGIKYHRTNLTEKSVTFSSLLLDVVGTLVNQGTQQLCIT